MSVDGLAVSASRGASTVQRASSLDHSARVDPVAEADVPVDAVLGDGLAQVGQDRRPVGDRLVGGPRLEAVAERVHVAVGAHARVAEQVPRAADVVAPLEDHVRPVGALTSQVVGGADAGDPGADDDDIKVFSVEVFRRGSRRRRSR